MWFGFQDWVASSLKCLVKPETPREMRPGKRKLLEPGGSQVRIGGSGHPLFFPLELELRVLSLTRQAELDTRSRGPGLWHASWPQGRHSGSYPIPDCNLSDVPVLRFLWEGKGQKPLGWSAAREVLQLVCVWGWGPVSQVCGETTHLLGFFSRHARETGPVQGQSVPSLLRNSRAPEGPASSACSPSRTRVAAAPLRPPAPLQKGSVMFEGPSLQRPEIQILEMSLGSSRGPPAGPNPVWASNSFGALFKT